MFKYNQSGPKCKKIHLGAYHWYNYYFCFINFALRSINLFVALQ